MAADVLVPCVVRSSSLWYWLCKLPRGGTLCTCSHLSVDTRWRHEMETFSALLAICAGNLPVTGEFPTQMPVMRSFDVFFHFLWFLMKIQYDNGQIQYLLITTKGRNKSVKFCLFSTKLLTRWCYLRSLCFLWLRDVPLITGIRDGFQCLWLRRCDLLQSLVMIFSQHISTELDDVDFFFIIFFLNNHTNLIIHAAITWQSLITELKKNINVFYWALVHIITCTIS